MSVEMRRTFYEKGYFVVFDCGVTALFLQLPHAGLCDPFDTYDTNPIMEEEETPPRIAPRWASGNIENGEYVEQGSHEYITAKACDILTKDKGFFSMNESANVFIVLAISIASLTPDKDENKNIFEGHFYHAIDGDSWTGSKTNTALVNCRNHFDSAVHAAKVGDMLCTANSDGRSIIFKMRENRIMRRIL